MAMLNFLKQLCHLKKKKRNMVLTKLGVTLSALIGSHCGVLNTSCYGLGSSVVLILFYPNFHPKIGSAILAKKDNSAATARDWKAPVYKMFILGL